MDAFRELEDIAQRSLLGGGHGNDSGDDDAGPHDDTQPLRIAAIFVILASALLGAVPPLFLKVFRDPNSTLTRLVRSFSAGVIIALALVHIIPEAVEELAGIGDLEFPIGGCCVLFGITVMVLLEHFAHVLHHVKPAVACDVEAVAVKPAAAAEACPVPSVDHGHTCVSYGTANNWAALQPEPVGTIRLKIVAYMFELGCVFHSFIIGLSLGVSDTDITEVRALFIALAFHQFLEGVSLASVVNRGGFRWWKGLMMIVLYSLTTPIGIAVGMGIAETYDSGSTRTRGLQGTFNGVSGGMLLYISLVQLVAEDMGRFTEGRDSAKLRLLSFVALALGAASMCVLAIWA